jgi:hypothetical protein
LDLAGDQLLSRENGFKYSRANRRLRFTTLAIAAEVPRILGASWPARRFPEALDSRIRVDVSLLLRLFF